MTFQVISASLKNQGAVPADFGDDPPGATRFAEVFVAGKIIY
jgi:hypothetical protein